MEFVPFEKVQQIGKAGITITQKLHGSNAQVLITDDNQVFTGSRTRWITPEEDNYGFAAFVESNKQEFIELLGPGRWDGEWVGPGINSGEGFTEKHFVLFNIMKLGEGRPLPKRVLPIPLLYKGAFSSEAIAAAMEDLKTNGSKIVPGFMRPEGVVIHLMGTNIRFKKVFQQEDTAWKKTEKQLSPVLSAEKIDVSHLYQPIRLEKLLSRDESYLVNFPKSLPTICSDYVADLINEEQITGTADEIKAIKKSMGGDLFKFVKDAVHRIQA